MSKHFTSGAFIRGTETFVTVNNAKRGEKYECPHCNGPVCFKRGKILRPHFAHHASDNPCYYYDKPSESQIHKDAKFAIRTELNEHREFAFYRVCSDCKCETECFRITADLYNENTKGMCEYDCRFKYNDAWKIPDVALVDDGKIVFISEICYKHKTLENNRPPDIPWVEIKAESFIQYINSTDDVVLKIQCMRDYVCDKCIQKNAEKERQIENERLKREELERERIAQAKIKEQNRIEQVKINEQRRIQQIIFEREQRQRIEKDRLNREIKYNCLWKILNNLEFQDKISVSFKNSDGLVDVNEEWDLFKEKKLRKLDMEAKKQNQINKERIERLDLLKQEEERDIAREKLRYWVELGKETQQQRAHDSIKKRKSNISSVYSTASTLSNAPCTHP